MGNRRRKPGEETGNKSSKDFGFTSDLFNPSDNMIKDVGNMTFFTPLGANLHLPYDQFNYNTGDIAEKSRSISFPGIMTIKVVPTFGRSTNVKSHLNVVMGRLYQYVRKMNSGSTNYEPVDLLQHVLAMDSIYSALLYIKRVYNCLSAVNSKNYYYYRSLVEAQGIYFEELEDKLPQIRSKFNQIVVQLENFPIPRTMRIFLRHAGMFETIYKESDDPKAQLYMFVPDGFYTFEEKDTEQPGYLSYDRWWSEEDHSIFELLDRVKEMANKVFYSQDASTISGDIQKAYPPGDMWKLNYLTEDDNKLKTSLMPRDVQLEIVNAEIYEPTEGTLNITQDVENESIWIFDPKFEDGTPITHMCFMDTEDPTAMDVMHATRLKLPSVNGVSGGSAYVTINADEFDLPSEIVTGITLWYVAKDGRVRGYNLTNTSDVISDTTANRSSLYALQKALNANNFEYMPKRAMYAYDSESGTHTTLGFYGDVDNYRLFSPTELSNINATAMQSLLGLADQGYIVNNF